MTEYWIGIYPDEKTPLRDYYEAGYEQGKKNASESIKALLAHIASMADDVYLTGHPEWLEIVKESKELESK